MKTAGYWKLEGNVYMKGQKWEEALAWSVCLFELFGFVILCVYFKPVYLPTGMHQSNDLWANAGVRMISKYLS